MEEITANQTKSNLTNNFEIIKKEILDKLSVKGSSGFWIWHIFFLCFIPGILNGLQISSYVFIAQNPDEINCIVSDLTNAGWTNGESINISTSHQGNTIVNDGCNILNWDYDKLKKMNYEDAVDYTSNMNLPNTVRCLSRRSNYYKYNFNGFDRSDVSIVSEWNLVCDSSKYRTDAQGSLALGKLIGAFIFGIFADKFGRRITFIIASVIYIISGPWAAYVHNYTAFIIARISIGIAGSGTYHTAYTILSEVTAKNYRYWMSIAYSAGYPLGMILCALCAYLIPQWRLLQLTLSLPALILIYHMIFLVESPRWLLNEKRVNEAYKIVFNTKSTFDEKTLINDEKNSLDDKNTFKGRAVKSFKLFVKELVSLYGSVLRNRSLICHFLWFACSLSYYAIALNAENFSANRYIYMMITGVSEIPSYIMPIIFLKYIGRKITSQILFGISGISLLIIIAIPHDSETAIVTVAMLGRLCISAAYSVVMLYTSDLFPTENRASAIGTCATCAHVGSISAPYIVDLLGAIVWFIPTTICAGTAILSVGLLFWLPETKEKELTDRIDEEM